MSTWTLRVSFRGSGFGLGLITPFKASAWVYSFFGFRAPVIPFSDWDFVFLGFGHGRGILFLVCSSVLSFGFRSF